MRSKSVTYDATPNDNTDDDQVIVLKDIAKKPTTTNAKESKRVYQTNDVAAATFKIWDTRGGNQAVLSATKLKTLFKDDNYLDADLLTQANNLSALVEGNKVLSLNTPLTSDPFNQTNQTPPVITGNGND